MQVDGTPIVDEPPPPRARRRKAGQAAPQEAVDMPQAQPLDGATEAAEEPEDKPRRRSRKRRRAEELSTLAQRIWQYHQIIAAFTASPELVISEAEATALAESGSALADEFDLELGGKWVALAAFAITAGGIYIPRLVVRANRARTEREQHAQQAAPEPTGDAPGPMPNGPVISEAGVPYSH